MDVQNKCHCQKRNGITGSKTMRSLPVCWYIDLDLPDSDLSSLPRQRARCVNDRGQIPGGWVSRYMYRECRTARTLQETVIRFYGNNTQREVRNTRKSPVALSVIHTSLSSTHLSEHGGGGGGGGTFFFFFEGLKFWNSLNEINLKKKPQLKKSFL